jgi:hypothetical protein
MNWETNLQEWNFVHRGNELRLWQWGAAFKSCLRAAAICRYFPCNSVQTVLISALRLYSETLRGAGAPCIAIPCPCTDIIQLVLCSGSLRLAAAWDPCTVKRPGDPYVCSVPCRRPGWPCPCDTRTPAGGRRSGTWLRPCRRRSCWRPGERDSAGYTSRSVGWGSGRVGNVSRPDIESCRRSLREWGRAHAVTRAHCLPAHK